MLWIGQDPEAWDLDSSWGQALSDAFVSHRVWGRDLVFTYGPLGFLQSKAPFDERTFWIVFAYWSLSAALLVLCLTWLLWQVDGTTACGILIAGYLLLPLQRGDAFPLVLCLFQLALCIRIAEKPTLGRFDLLVLLLLPPQLAILAVMKFSLAIAVAVTSLFAAGILFFSDRRRLAVSIPAYTVVTILLFWLLAGQPINAIPNYLSLALEISRGYMSAMSKTPSGLVDLAGVFTLMLLAMCFLLRLRQHTNAATKCYLIGIASIVALSWKAGYIRADRHTAIFFVSATMVPAFLSVAPARIRLAYYPKVTLAVTGLCLFLGLLAAMPEANLGRGSTSMRVTSTEAAQRSSDALSFLLHPRLGFSEWVDRRHDLERAAQLPDISSLVGSETTDILVFNIGVALFNHLRYSPRPVLQSYSAYTPTLAKLNADFFSAETAPHFALIQIQPIDDHLPFEEDGRALVSILRHYDYVGLHDNFLVFRRNTAKIDDPVWSFGKAEHHQLNAWVPMENGTRLQAMSIRYRMNNIGSVYAMVVREPEMMIDVRLPNGTLESFRLIREIAADGLIFNPFIGDYNTFYHWLENEDIEQPVAFRIRPKSIFYTSYFESDYELRLSNGN